jgi:hypothetical protein
MLLHTQRADVDVQVVGWTLAIVNKGSSGPCRIFQIVGSAIVIFVKLRGNGREEARRLLFVI